MIFRKAFILDCISNLREGYPYPSYPLHEILELDPLHLSWIEPAGDLINATENYIFNGITFSTLSMNYHSTIKIDKTSMKHSLSITCEHKDSTKSIWTNNKVFKRSIYITLLRVRLIELGLKNDDHLWIKR